MCPFSHRGYGIKAAAKDTVLFVMYTIGRKTTIKPVSMARIDEVAISHRKSLNEGVAPGGFFRVAAQNFEAQ